MEGEVDPVRDLEIISNELRLKYLQYIEKQIVRLGLGLGLGLGLKKKKNYILIYGYKWLNQSVYKRETERERWKGGREGRKDGEREGRREGGGR